MVRACGQQCPKLGVSRHLRYGSDGAAADASSAVPMYDYGGKQTLT